MWFVFVLISAPDSTSKSRRNPPHATNPLVVRLCDLCDLYGHTARHSQPRSDLPGSRHATPLIPIVSLFAYPLPGFHPSASALLVLAARLIFWGSYNFSSTTRLHFFSCHPFCLAWSSDQTFLVQLFFKARQRVEGARTKDRNKTIAHGVSRRHVPTGQGRREGQDLF